MSTEGLAAPVWQPDEKMASCMIEQKGREVLNCLVQYGRGKKFIKAVFGYKSGKDI